MNASKNGVLQKKEFFSAMKHFGMDDNRVESLMKILDLNDDGNVSYTKFLCGCGSFETLNLINASELIFNLIDKDNNGEVDFDEFKSFFDNQKIN